jgi:HD-GYP domain-containing protein (c-di-GMP phosphodiesterase class II)
MVITLPSREILRVPVSTTLPALLLRKLRRVRVDSFERKKLRCLFVHQHERIDGSGFPNGLRGKEIPLGSRIITIADSYDALTTDRPYRPALSQAAALAELTRCSGTQFDADVVNAFRVFLGRQNGLS